MRIYLDNAATTRIAKEVIDVMLPFLKDKYGNASSIHLLGRDARIAIENARNSIAKKINAESDEIIFTSGGTEANNLAIKGIAFANKGKKHIVISKIEHNSIIKPVEWLKKFGFEISYVNVDKFGMVDVSDVENALRKDTLLVSIMHANNEVGTIQPIEEIAKLCDEKGIYFHTDACQSFTKIKIDVKRLNAHLISLNSHKIHGPKGIGALFVRNRTKIDPLIHGGGHEFNLRSGTENVANIVGFGKAVNVINRSDIEKMRELREYMKKRIVKEIENIKFNGHPEKRLCNINNFTFKGIESDSLVLRLDMEGIACSTASACSTYELKPSHVLLAMGLKRMDALSSVRFSLSKFNTKDELNYFIEVLKNIVDDIRGFHKETHSRPSL